MLPIRYLCLMFCLIGSLFLTACGGSSSDDAATEETGSLALSLTDAEEDFLTYKVTLDSVSLVRRDGTQVELLPVETEVDFVQYRELSELFAVLSVPAGHYDEVRLNLDYSDAEVVIQDQNGDPQIATLIDNDGDPVTTMSVELTLNDGETIHIRPRAIAQLSLDLDLAASNTIVTYEPPVVQVAPFIIGETVLDMQREHRVRGLLDSVDAATDSFVVDIRPMRVHRGPFGQLTVHVNNDTRYEINGVELDGDAGLAALAELPDDSPVVAFGAPSDEEDVRFLATKVNAGSSVPWADQDVLKGVITARTEKTLTLHGAVVELAQGEANFHEDVTIELSEDTVISGYRLGDADLDTLSIGQEIVALGDFDSEHYSFDADHVRMVINRLVGQVTQTSPLLIDLSHINRRSVDHFEFAGTGVDTENDANPLAYEIDTGALNTTGLELNEWIQVRGYPTAFGSAPMDFDALTIIDPDFSAHPARFDARWERSASATVSVTETGLLVAGSQARSTRLHLREIPSHLVEGLSVNNIVCSDNNGRFAVKGRRGGIHLFRDFSSFQMHLNTLLNGTPSLKVKHLSATGQYNGETATLDADVVTVHLH